ncbi:MAG: glycoside hydrolase family 43 protein [Agathobacter sp.]|nr:glycoside hydrolase family 43 protein [Agathobacter sp.]
MRKGFKVLCSVAMALVLTFGTATIFTADTESANVNTDVSVELTTDKESYSSGDEVVVTVKVTNNTEAEVSDLNIRVNWPEGLSFANAEDEVLVLDTLAAGESKTFEVVGTQGSSMMTILLVVIVAVLLIAAVVILLMIFKKKGKKAATAAAMAFAMIITMLPTTLAEAGVKMNAEAVITLDGEEATVGATITYNQYYLSRISHPTVHDPSVVYDPETDMYYIFGSHMAWAKSKDLISWTTFKNNINTDYRTLFAEPIKWSAKGSTSYDVSGNMWAPDVIYNEALGKWTMYMSINGDNWYSSIVLLTADSLDGDWTYVGPVVYSGFQSKEQALETDFYDVYTGDDFPARYNETRGGSHSYGLNAIDPCVFYDEEGHLWMAYGSWFGGIYMLELDPATGMRLSSRTYETVENQSDEYQGIKIAGGLVVSGEGAYIEYVDGYYYLYLSYGGLTSDGGYNMRVFRSENPDGPYVDLTGDSAIAKSGNNNINSDIGVRVMGNYQWDYVKAGQIAQGHNSVYSDENGIFVVYHTRFTNQGEVHSVRVHQQFVNEDGWLVTAPFEYTGEGLCYVDKEDVAGDYKVIVHKLKINYANKKCNTTVDVSLKENGTISGDLEGTWKFSEKLGAPYVTMTIDDVEYNGVFVKQRMENSGNVVMTFTVLGDDELNVWGYMPVEE